MNSRRHLTLVAAASAILAAMPLATVFEQWTWLVYSFVLVGVICGIAVLVRSMRAPAWLPTVAMTGGYLMIMSWLFASGKEYLGIIPNLDTVRHFNDLLVTASQEMRTYGVPVEDRAGFLFLATLGVGGVAILVDLFAVVLRRPALAGLPMLAIYSVPVAVHTDSISIWPFILGAAGFLWLLVADNVDRVRRFGRRFTGDGRDIDAWEPSPLAAAGQRLGLIGIVLAVVLPLAVPGMTGGLLDRIGSSSGPGVGAGSGTGVGLEAMLSGELQRDRTVNMVKVTTNDPNPYYLRFAIADQLGPNGFTARTNPQGRPVDEGLPEARAAQGGVTHGDYRATVDVVNFSTRFLPVYLQPEKINDLQDEWAWDQQQSVLFTNRSQSQKKQYSFEYSRVEYAPEVLARAKPLPASSPIQRQYTQRPPSAEVDRLVAELTAGKTNPFDRVRAIFDYFSPANGFSYTLATEPANTGSALLDFLTNKRGYCVQYAAALGWLVRAAGVPARVVFGFTRGSATTPGNTTSTLTNFNLHSWTEVYLDGFGWMPFDATPATDILGSVSPPYAPNPSRPSDAQTSQQGDDTLNPAAPETSASAAAPGAEGGNVAPDPAGGPAASSTARWPIWTVLGVLGGLLLLGIPAARRAALRRRRMQLRPVPVSTLSGANAGAAAAGPGGGHGRGGHGGDGHGDGSAGNSVPSAGTARGPALVMVPDDATQLAARLHAHAAWDELLDTMIDYRLPIDDAETPRATAERLVSDASLAKEPSAGARLLGQAEERARYSRTALPDDQLAPALTGIRTALAGRASRRTRLQAVLLPPSIIARWQLATVAASSQLFNAVARGLDQAGRLVSVRRLIAGRAGR